MYSYVYTVVYVVSKQFPKVQLTNLVSTLRGLGWPLLRGKVKVKIEQIEKVHIPSNQNFQLLKVYRESLFTFETATEDSLIGRFITV